MAGKNTWKWYKCSSTVWPRKMPSYQASDPITTESRGVDESGVKRNLKEIKTPPHPHPLPPLLPTHLAEMWTKEKFWDHLNGGWTEASDWLISCTAVTPNYCRKTTDVYFPAAVGCPEGSFERGWIKKEKHDNQPCFIDNNKVPEGVRVHEEQNNIEWCFHRIPLRPVPELQTCRKILPNWPESKHTVEFSPSRTK